MVWPCEQPCLTLRYALLCTTKPNTSSNKPALKAIPLTSHKLAPYDNKVCFSCHLLLSSLWLSRLVLRSLAFKLSVVYTFMLCISVGCNGRQESSSSSHRRDERHGPVSHVKSPNPNHNHNTNPNPNNNV